MHNFESPPNVHNGVPVNAEAIRHELLNREASLKAVGSRDVLRSIACGVGIVAAIGEMLNRDLPVRWSQLLVAAILALLVLVLAFLLRLAAIS